MSQSAALAPRAGMRGAAVGAVSAALSIAGHGWGLPGHGPALTSSSVALLLAVAAAAGAGVTTARPLRRGRSGVLTALVLGQLAGHFALSAGAGHGPQLSWTMAGAHLAAALVAVLIIGGAERGYQFGVTVLARLLRAELVFPAADARPACPEASRLGCGTDRAGGVRTRAPPRAQFA